MGSIKAYLKELAALSDDIVATNAEATPYDLHDAIADIIVYLKTSKRVFVIGNGGSASIASHCASHFPRGRGMSIDPLNDISALTATANDFGYENSYARQLMVKAWPTDLLIAVSSSGNSANIKNAAIVAKEMGCRVVTLSGFSADNPLRILGDVNLYVPSSHYGHIELTHMALLHAAFDLMEVE